MNGSLFTGQKHRRGAALIFAVVILAAMLMMGLPFIFSMSSALSGSHHFRARSGADTGVETALDMAKGLTSAAVTYRMSVAPVEERRFTALDVDLNAALTGSGSASTVMQITDPDSIRTETLDVDYTQLTGNPLAGGPSQPRFGITIEDEGAKLDVNAMDETTWGRILGALNITSATAKTLADLRFTYWHFDMPDINDPSTWVHDPAKSRIQRIVDLQELEAAGLNKADIERLRPYITAHPRPQGRDGLVDLGTVLEATKTIELGIAVRITPGATNAGLITETGRHHIYVSYPSLIGGISNNYPKPPTSDSLGFHRSKRNLDVTSSDPSENTWINQWRMTFRVQDLEQEPTAWLISPSGATITSMTWPNDDPNELLEWYNIDPTDGDFDREVRLELDGNPQQGVIGSSVLVFERNGDEFRFRCKDDTTCDTNSIKWDYVQNDEQDIRLNHFIPPGNSGYPAIAKEVFTPININHAPPLVVLAIGKGGVGPTPSDNPEDIDIAELRTNGSLASAYSIELPLNNGQTDTVLAWNDSFRGAFETIPISIRSWGTFTAHVRSATGDGLDRLAAQSQDRVIIQAGGGDSLTPLKRSWATQADFERLRADRHLSMVAAHPRAGMRVAGQQPQEGDLNGANISPEWAEEYLHPGVLPGMASLYAPVPDGNNTVDTERVTLDSLTVDWARPMRGHANNSNSILAGWAGVSAASAALPDDEAAALRRLPGGINPTTPAEGSISALPDGVEINGKLSYYLDNEAGPLRPEGSFNEMEGRHFSMWFKPNTNWTTGEVPIMQMRAHESNVYPEMSEILTGGSTAPSMSATAADFQNLFRLHYDVGKRSMVLTLANPAIPHSSDVSNYRSGTDIGWAADIAVINDSISDPNLELPLGPWYQSGLKVPMDQVSDNDPDGNYSRINEESLGESHAEANNALAPAVPLQRTEFWYYVGDTGLKEDVWYHLQVFLSHDRPGGQSIVINGLAGRTSLPGQTLQAGDSVTLPSLYLAENMGPNTRNDLPANQDPANNGSGASLIEGDLDLDVSPMHTQAGYPTADTMLPQRGMVLIGDEYISYDGIAGNTLQNAYRGLRANTVTFGTSPADDESGNNQPGVFPARWPTLQPHRVNDLVVPGGYRLNDITGGDLFEGVNYLASDFDNGDPLQEWRIWGRVSHDPDDHRADPTTGVDRWDSGEDHVFIYDRPGDREEVIEYWITTSATTIKTYTEWGSPDPVDVDVELNANDHLVLSTVGTGRDGSTPVVFPSPGIIAVSSNNIPDAGDLYLAYESYDPTTMTFIGLHHWDHPDYGADPNEYSWQFIQGDDPTPNPPFVISIALPVVVPNLGNFEYDDYIQLEDPEDGRIEWIEVDRVAEAIPYMRADTTGTTTGYFDAFINDQGFSYQAGNRGAQRTVFSGGALEAGLGGLSDGDFTNPDKFIRGSRILPVQGGNTGGNHWHWLATGDVITLLPQDIDGTDPTKVPTQMVVRFGATDGYSHSPDAVLGSNASGYDTVNERFTLTEPVVVDFDLDETAVISGLGWSGLDLSSLNPMDSSNIKKGFMPRIDAASAAYEVDNTGVLTLWSDHNGYANVVVDELAAGPLPGAVAGTSKTGRVTHFFIADSVSADPNNPGNRTWSFSSGMDDTLLTTNTADTIGKTLIALENRDVIPDGIGFITIGGELMVVTSNVGSDITGPLRSALGLSNNEVRALNLVRLVGRGILGKDTIREHRVMVSPYYKARNASYSSSQPHQALNYRVGPTAIATPIGPVKQMYNSFKVSNSPSVWQHRTYLDPGYTGNMPGSANDVSTDLTLVVNPDGTAYEIVANPNDWVMTWLRGLGNTEVQDWTDEATMGFSPDEGTYPLAIGWYSRFPSAQARDYHLGMINPLDMDRFHRTRTYAWASFPLHMGALTPAGAEATVQTGGPTTYPELITDLRWRAKSTGFDWDGTASVTGDDPNSVFVTGGEIIDFHDTAELRAHWYYTNPPYATPFSGSDYIWMDMHHERKKITSVTLKSLAETLVLERGE